MLLCWQKYVGLVESQMKTFSIGMHYMQLHCKTARLTKPKRDVTVPIQCITIVKWIEYGFYEEYIVVHSKMMFYLLQDGCKRQEIKLGVGAAFRDGRSLPDGVRFRGPLHGGELMSLLPRSPYGSFRKSGAPT